MQKTLTSPDIQTDKFQKIGQSLIYHGKYNDKAYLLKLAQKDLKDMPDKLENLAEQNNYGKILVKAPTWAQPLFQQHGYVQEAYIPGYYKGEENMFFMALYRDKKRNEVAKNPLNTLTDLLYHTENETNPKELQNEIKIRMATPDDIYQMATLYQKVFETYPFPIHDPEYLKETMLNKHVFYFGAWNNNELMGMCSAEVDASNRNAEMTDFAVLPKYRGKNLASHLLQRTEQEMKRQQYKTLYAIARLVSTGMNKTFIQQGYRFSGILRKNTQISGGIESMNVYYKNI